MKRRSLGNGLRVSSLGLGCMGMSEFYGAHDDASSRAVMAAALDLGMDFFDTADMYGSHHNEELIGGFLRGLAVHPKIATKFGIVRKPGEYDRTLDNSPGHVRAACEGSLRRLGLERIDLYYVHRVDPFRPIEETMQVLADLVRDGKVAHVGLCEVSAQTLRRAHAVHPVTAVQSEYSLWTRDVEEEVLPACRALGIGFVPYSPLGRGFLTGKYRRGASFGPGDLRNAMPRFEAEALAHNLAIVEAVEKVAERLGCTAAQLCLAWLLAQGDDIVPIPGTKQLRYLRENARAERVELSAVDLVQLREAVRAIAVVGERYTPEGMKGVHV